MIQKAEEEKVQLEQQIKQIKIEADKKKELDEELKKIMEEKKEKEEALENLQKEVELKENEVFKKEEENKKLLEEKKNLAEENAKKEAFLKEKKNKEKEVLENNKEIVAKIKEEKKEKEQAIQKVKNLQMEKKKIEEQSKIEIEKIKKDISQEMKNKENVLLEEKKALEAQLKKEEKERKAVEKRFKKIEEQIKIKAEKDLKKQQKEFDQKIKIAIEKGIEDYKNKNNIILNNLDIDDQQLQMNIDGLNKQSEFCKNQLQIIKEKCFEELNQKYSKILQQQIQEIQKTLIKDAQKQNKKILEKCIKKYEDSEKKRKEEYTNSLSKIMLSNVNQKEGENSISLITTTHHGIKCQKCGMEPIIGYRYKCSVCTDFNLCDTCEQKNEVLQEHLHDFIKMRNEEKKEDKKEEKKEPKKKKIVKKKEKEKEKQPKEQIEYKYELLDSNPEKYSQIVFMEDEKDVKFEFGIKNTSNIDFPQKGKTKFVFDKKICKIPDIVIDELRAGNDKNLIVNIPLKKMNLGENKIKMVLNIDGKNYGNEIILTIKYKSKQVDNFRNDYSLNEEDYDDQRLLGLLQKQQFDFQKAFESLFNSN